MHVQPAKSKIIDNKLPNSPNNGGRRGINIEADGYQMYARNIQAIRKMSFLVTADELGEFLLCCGLISSCIPDFHGMSQPQDEMLEEAYA